MNVVPGTMNLFLYSASEHEQSEPMKPKIVLAALGLAAVLLPGCVAFPPLIQVEHKETVSNQDIVKRLDAIDSRLDKIEKENEQK